METIEMLEIYIFPYFSFDFPPLLILQKNFGVVVVVAQVPQATHAYAPDYSF